MRDEDLSMYIKCPNCGAESDEKNSRCPYCGYINEKGAEKKYMDNLYEVRKNLDGLDEEAASGYKEGYRKTLTIVIVTLIILIVLTAVIFILYGMFRIRTYRNDLDSGNEVLEDMAWRQEAYKRFDELYEAGKYDELCETVFDACENGYSVYTYEHNDFIELYNDHLRTERELEAVEKKGEWDDYAAGTVFYYCCCYYYSDTGQADMFRGLSGEDIENLKPVTEEMKDILNNRLMFSDEEMENLADKLISSYGYLDYEKCVTLAKKRKSGFR